MKIMTTIGLEVSFIEGETSVWNARQKMAAEELLKSMLKAEIVEVKSIKQYHLEGGADE